MSVEVLPYIPQRIEMPPRCLKGDYGTSSWIGLESLLPEILERFNVGRSCALEFGVEHGYSLVAFSGLFGRVIGVDPFGQQTATEPIEPMEDRCRRNIAPYDNIMLVVGPWQDYTKNTADYDLIHVDAEHSYYDTFGIGDYACQHSPVVLFHDSVSFPDTVMPAIKDLAEKHNRKFYNFDKFHGLGILVKE